MRVQYINVALPQSADKAPRCTVGGRPIFAAEQQWPLCKLCKTPMMFFFQFDIEQKFYTALKSGSHLLVFMCLTHNDVPTRFVEDGEDQLPDSYWNKTYGHYALLLNSPGKERIGNLDKHIALRVLTFENVEEQIEWDGTLERGTVGFKVGGVPDWVNQNKCPRCSCGAEMVLACQVPAGFQFPKRKSAPTQVEAPSKEGYNLFLGRSAYIFACKNQCTPKSLHALTQDKADLPA